MDLYSVTVTDQPICEFSQDGYSLDMPYDVYALVAAETYGQAKSLFLKATAEHGIEFTDVRASRWYAGVDILPCVLDLGYVPR